jgi:hypothetical protein
MWEFFFLQIFTICWPKKIHVNHTKENVPKLPDIEENIS